MHFEKKWLGKILRWDYPPDSREGPYNMVRIWLNVWSEAIYYGIPALSICGSYVAYKFLLLPRDRTFLTKVTPDRVKVDVLIQDSWIRRALQNIFQAKYHQSNLVWFGLFGSILIALPRFIYSMLLGTSVLEQFLRVLPSNQIRIFSPSNRIKRTSFLSWKWPDGF